MVILPRISTWW